MDIRDVLHGAIRVNPIELKVVDSPFFQRLRFIKQVGFSEFSFPGASHNRYIHSLGAMEIAGRAFDRIFSNQIPESAFERFRTVLRLAALLHDIGHGPFSHTSEIAMPPLRELRIPSPGFQEDRQASHEDYTLKIILDSDLTDILRDAGADLGFGPNHIASLICPKIDAGDAFFKERIGKTQVDFHPILHQLISSEIDADRMDYLRRDSLYAGVSYGEFDLDWLVSNLTFYIQNERCFLALEHRALYTFEDFLISRFHMFLMVYFHHKGVVYDEMLAKYLLSPNCDYKLPSNIREYCECNDSHLSTHLAQSSNEWAQRIAEKRPYRMLLEIHSGIPATDEGQRKQLLLLEEVKAHLQKNQIDYLLNTSTGELSKYFSKPGDPIFVRYENHFTPTEYIPLDRCTDLFQKYSEKRSITRIYVSPENYPRAKNLAPAKQ